MAAGAPIETKTGDVPAVVKESQEKAHVDPEASAVPAEVEEKATVEKELLDRVSEAPTTSEGTAGVGTQKTENTVTPGEAAASVAAAATALGGAAVAGAIAAKNIAVDKGSVAATSAQDSATQAAANLPDSAKAYLPESVQNAIGTTSKEATIQETAPAVPVEVKESLAEAHQSPEAAASASAVEDKSAVEKQLLGAIKPAPAVGEAPASKKTDYTGEPATVVKNVTEPKIENVAASEAFTSDLTTKEPQNEPVSTAVDKALANAEKTTAEPETTTESKTETAAVPTTESTTTPTTAANGNGASTTAAAPATPAKSTTGSSKAEESPATADKKKKNRISAFFGKLKEKTNKK